MVHHKSSCNTASVPAWIVMAMMSLAVLSPAAGADDSGAVNVNAKAKIEKLPDIVRLQFNINGEGKDVKEAMAQLAEREKAARQKLEALKVVPESIKVNEPELATAENDPQARLEMMMQMRGGRGGPKPAAPSAAVVKLTASVRAEWNVTAKSMADLLVEAHDLQKKIKAAKLMATGPAKELTPAEQEEAEERAMLLAESGGQVQTEPTVLFVARLTKDDIAKLNAEAFAKARDAAGKLATAAGAELGAVKQITAGTAPMGGSSYDDYQYAMYNRRGQPIPEPDDDAAPEAVGVTAGKVSYQVLLTASFALKPAGK